MQCQVASGKDGYFGQKPAGPRGMPWFSYTKDIQYILYHEGRAAWCLCLDRASAQG
jgi:hypothetical protein